MRLPRVMNYKSKILRLNSLFLYFFLSQSLFLLIYFYQTPLISKFINTDKAVWMHIMGVCWCTIGYFTARFPRLWHKDYTENKRYFFSSRFYLFSYFLIIFGTIESMVQVFLFVSPMEYISHIFSSYYYPELRAAFHLSHDEGGLPGIIKMFAYAPLSIYLMSFGLLNFLHLDIADMQKLKRLNRMALLGTAIKVFFALDHLTIMAVLMANIFIGIQKVDTKNIKFFLYLIIIFFIADFLSSKRLEGFGIIDFTLLYLKLGLVNFQLMIDTCSGYTYGFSTIFSPLTFIFKFFSLPLPHFESSFQWEWTHFQYFTSYAFQDFGYFYFVLFYLIGFILYFIDFNTLKRKNIYTISIYFVVLYGIISFLVVPAIQGMEFWLALLLPVVLLNRFTMSSERKR